MAGGVVAVFSSESSILEAIGLLRAEGFKSQQLTLLTAKRVPFWKLRARARHPKLGRRIGLLGAILWGALIGGVVVEIAGVAAALVFLQDAPVQWFVAVWVWKGGAFLGGFIGTFIYEGRGPDLRPSPLYEETLGGGAYVLAVAVTSDVSAGVRGLLIESGGEGVQDVTDTLYAPEEDTEQRAKRPPKHWSHQE